MTFLGPSWVTGEWFCKAPSPFTSIKSGVLLKTWRKQDTVYSKVVSKKLQPNPGVSGNLLIRAI